MPDIINPIIQFSVYIPGALLAYCPMKHHLRISSRKLALIGIPLLILLCIGCGSLCYILRIKTLWISTPLIIAFTAVYCSTINVSKWKSISVILAICGVFACLDSIAKATNSMLSDNSSAPWYCFESAAIYSIMCWVFFLFALYPATHAALELLDDEGIAQTWYVFWLLPVVSIGVNLFMIPFDPEILLQGRLLQGYIVISCTLLLLLLLSYAFLYFIARSLSRNDRLRQENQFLSMQQSQYERLCKAIEETRQARHDMRHHFSVLSALAERKEWEELKDYLGNAWESIPNVELNLCDNQAVDGVAGHFCLSFKENQIPFSINIDLPRKLPVSEIDMCLIMSNLLENALEASLRTEKTKRYIKFQAYLHSDNVVLITVENKFDGIIKEKNGVFQSSKRKGDGVGLQSVRSMAEKNGGYCRFTQSNGVFCANVMLRGEKAD